MEKNNSCGLAINSEVVAQIASMATLEIEGVAGMASRPTNVKNIFNRPGAFKAIKVTVVDPVVNIDVYISVKDTARLKEVSEAVQRNVKEKVQTMTGNAVTRVNVFVANIEITPDTPQD